MLYNLNPHVTSSTDAQLDAYDHQRSKDLGYDYEEKEQVPLWLQYFGNDVTRYIFVLFPK